MAGRMLILAVAMVLCPLAFVGPQVRPVAVAPRCHGAAPPHCVVHRVATALAAAGMPTTTQDLRLRFLRRLLRSQVYYMLAATMGTILLLCGSFPWRCFVFLQRRPGVMREMVEGADDSQLSAMTCLAAAAMTHWLFAIVEDWLAWRYLAVHCQEQMSVQEHQIVQSASALCWIYTAHHFLAATVFGSFLLFEELAVLCCFGAFFELPVCFTNLRDLVVTFHKELEEVSSRFPLLSASFCRSWWNLTGFLVLLGRGSALLSFAYATALWNQELQQELPTVTSFAFRFYGASFTHFGCTVAIHPVVRATFGGSRSGQPRLAPVRLSSGRFEKESALQGSHPQQPNASAGGTPSTSSSFSLTTFDESEENSKSASVVVYFVVGLLFPLLGGFNLGILLAALGYGLSYGSIVNFAKKNETLKEYSSSIDDVGLAGVKAGEYALKAYNFVAAKVNAAL
ncbi:unnamed protein product [Cladocopium goreaui]|uniref:Uncharacterized protein n=1 Tax=Cladocopium goreaui TaxID=2562237 RepID=A0A9P1CLU0_9DINO|nr:unnamed protein product [Cladocopium goreaui]